DTLKVIENVRKVSERIAILLDTKGPEIRTTKTSEAIELKKNDLIKIKGGGADDVSNKDLVFLNYKKFSEEIKVGTSILIDDGELELKVIKKQLGHLVCRALNNGVIKSNKSVNVPNVHLDLPSLSQKDKDYINFAIKHNLDFIAHSFVRNKSDVMAIQKMLNAKKSRIKIIAKIENEEGVRNIDEILSVSHGIMIARGDLGIEIPAEEIPLIQKRIVKKCIEHHKPVIIATQMMHSMIKNPRPTRAEVSDVANAIMDGTDAVMLSGETASGEYPLETVKIMVKIIRQIEHNTQFLDLPVFNDEKHITNYLIKSAIKTSKELDAKEILVSTKSGFSTALLASYRGRIPVYAKCGDKRTVRELGLTYGVNAHFIEDKKTNTIEKIVSELIKSGKLAKKDVIIYLAGDSSQKFASYSMKVCEAGECGRK
ncbi:MAG: pyruvate kinase, partial [Candidatus Falkowbacteria bacterium]|nr:pyruvate kinase [Candidatus Falkowbacteria bacterium]